MKPFVTFSFWVSLRAEILRENKRMLDKAIRCQQGLAMQWSRVVTAQHVGCDTTRRVCLQGAGP